MRILVVLVGLLVVGSSFARADTCVCQSKGDCEADDACEFTYTPLYDTYERVLIEGYCRPPSGPLYWVHSHVYRHVCAYMKYGCVANQSEANNVEVDWYSYPNNFPLDEGETCSGTITWLGPQPGQCVTQKCYTEEE
jgi:hypothetical protein